MATALVVTLVIKPDNFTEFVSLAREHAARSLEREPGCESFEVLLPEDVPNQVILVEIYQNELALEAHWQSPHMIDYIDRSKSMIMDRRRIRCSV